MNAGIDEIGAWLTEQERRFARNAALVAEHFKLREQSDPTYHRAPEPPRPRIPPPYTAEQLAELDELRRASFGSADAREGRAAFLAKRPPRFVGE